jgi:pimeloyl-ACP methyl ester carboxylesterase
VHVDARRFAGRAPWVYDFGGVQRTRTYRAFQLTLFRRLATSHAYSPLELFRVIRAIPRTQDALLPDLVRMDVFDSVPSLDVPLSVFVGRHDRVAPPSIAEQYVEQVRASRGKNLVWFEQSAHTPQYEEPAAFRAALADAFEGFRGATDEWSPHRPAARIPSSHAQTPEARTS